jgi:hypothetical protein
MIPVKQHGYARSIILARTKVDAINQKPAIYHGLHDEPTGMDCNPRIKM